MRECVIIYPGPCNATLIQFFHDRHEAFEPKRAFQFLDLRQLDEGNAATCLFISAVDFVGHSAHEEEQILCLLADGQLTRESEEWIIDQDVSIWLTCL